MKEITIDKVINEIKELEAVDTEYTCIVRTKSGRTFCGIVKNVENALSDGNIQLLRDIESLNKKGMEQNFIDIEEIETITLIG